MYGDFFVSRGGWVYNPTTWEKVWKYPSGPRSEQRRRAIAWALAHSVETSPISP